MLSIVWIDVLRAVLAGEVMGGFELESETKHDVMITTVNVTAIIHFSFLFTVLPRTPLPGSNTPFLLRSP
jgi:hypothetical protein